MSPNYVSIAFAVISLVGLIAVFAPIRLPGLRTRKQAGITALVGFIAFVLGPVASPGDDPAEARPSVAAQAAPVPVGLAEAAIRTVADVPSPLRCGGHLVGREVVVSEQTAACRWAFSVPEVRLACHRRPAVALAPPSQEATATALGATYALNGTARQSYPALDPIWLAETLDPALRWDGPPIRVDIGDWINAALDLCDQPEPLAAGQHRIATAMVGCLSKADSAQLTRLAASGDTAAFTRAANIGLASGRCTMFEMGQAVYVDDVELFGDACLRRAGDVACWWAPPNAID